MYEVRLLLVGLESQAEVLFHHIAEFSGREDFEALGVSEEEADEFAVYDDVQFEDCGAVITSSKHLPGDVVATIERWLKIRLEDENVTVMQR